MTEEHLKSCNKPDNGLCYQHCDCNKCLSLYGEHLMTGKKFQDTGNGKGHMNFLDWYKSHVNLKYFQSKENMMSLYQKDMRKSQATAYNQYKKYKRFFCEKKEGRAVFIKLLEYLTEEENKHKFYYETSVQKEQMKISKLKKEVKAQKAEENRIWEEILTLSETEAKFCLNLIGSFNMDFGKAYRVTKTLRDFE